MKKKASRWGSGVPPMLLLVLLVLDVAGSWGGSGGGVQALPGSLFQLAPDTPSPAEPTPTQSAAAVASPSTSAPPPPDPCEGRPCLNGGLCLALDHRTTQTRQTTSWLYACTCAPGFTGRNCEVREKRLFWGFSVL